MPEEHRFPDANALAEVLAARVVGIVELALRMRGQASLIVSGGKTPQALFERLADIKLSWDKVWIALADERWVPIDDGASNEQFVRTHLLRNQAAGACFVSMKNPAPTPAAGAADAWRDYRVMPQPFDLVLLGMGEDGHTASLFPQSPGLAAALDPGVAGACVAMQAPVVPFARLSLNLAALLNAHEIIIASSGESKWQVYQKALIEGSKLDMPVRAVLRQQTVPVLKFWSP